ncbi:MAG: hypothetical protein JSW39_23235 [Desulfobacterales bacterium]|nr:MAG: hypothetical protein JSW39_23235 [Desulfobacterales bacterium]
MQAAAAIANPLAGRVISRWLDGDPDQSYLLYIPHNAGVGAPVFVTVHGLARHAQEQALSFAPLAERYGMVLVAPLFPRHRFADYQCLGYMGKGERADLALDRIMAEVGFLTGAKTDKIYLFGYSGGGEFAHRYALAYPQRVVRLAAAAAAWYTFPDPSVKFPFGLKAVPYPPPIPYNPQHFLSVPACVMVGETDVDRSVTPGRSRRLERQQGADRLERGRNWIQAMAAAAQKHHLNTPFHFQVLPACGHSFRQCMDQGGMGRLIFDFLLGPIEFLKEIYSGQCRWRLNTERQTGPRPLVIPRRPSSGTLTSS